MNKHTIFSGKKNIEEALKQLNAKIVYAELPSLRLVSCGGASLNIMGWVDRSTSDVDILCEATIGRGGKVRLEARKTLTPQLKKLIAEVGQELGLQEEWLNLGPALLMNFGLPTGIEQRLQPKSFGEGLTLFIISRLDQIHFKMYAAMNPKERSEIHLSDLLELGPSVEEARAAVRWLSKRKHSSAFKKKLKEVLDRIGHAALAQTF